MNAMGQGMSSGSGARSPEILAQVPAEGYASQVREAYERSPETTRTNPDVEISFLSDSMKRFVDKLEQEGFWAALVGLGTDLFKEAWNKLGELWQETFGKFFDLGDDLRKGIDAVKSGTVLEILKVALGGTLGVATITALAGIFQGNVPVEELLKIKDNPREMGALLVSKVRSGEVAVSPDLWAQLAGPLGLPATLPGVEAAREGVELVSDVAKEFDKESGLKELREGLVQYLDQNHTNWRQETGLDWVSDLSNIEKVMKDLGPSVVTALIAGGGPALIFMHLLGTPAWPITLNLALYGFLKTNNYVSAEILGFIEGLEEFTKTANEKVGAMLTAFDLDPHFLALESRNITSEKAIDYVFAFAKEHPELSAMAAINGAFLSSSFVFALAWRMGDFILSGAWSTIEFGWNHPGITLFSLFIAKLGYDKRRELFDKLARDILWRDDPEQQEIFLKWASETPLFKYEIAAQPTASEVIEDPLYRHLLEDPIDFLNDPENRRQFYERVDNGELAVRWDAVAGFGFSLLKATNPVWHAVHLQQHVAESFLTEMAEDRPGAEKAKIYVGLGFESFVVAAAGLGAMKGYCALAHDFNSDGRMISRLWRSMLVVTEESLFIWKSALRQAGDAVSFRAVSKMFQAKYIAGATLSANRMAVVAEDYLRARNAVPPDIRAVEKAKTQISNYLTTIEGKYNQFVDPKNLTYFDDLVIAERLLAVRNASKFLEEVVTKEEPPAAILERLRHLQGEISYVETRFSKLLNIGEIFSRNNSVSIRAAWKEIMELPRLNARGVAALDIAETLKKSPTELTAEVGRLRQEIAGLSESDPERAVKQVAAQRRIDAIEAFLDPSRVQRDLLRNLDFNGLTSPQAVDQIEQMAYHMESVEKGVCARVTQGVEETIAWARANGHALDSTVVQDRLRSLDDTVLQPFLDRKRAYLKYLNEQFDRLPAHLKTPRLKAALTLAHENSYLSRVVKGAKGRAIVAGVMLVGMVTVDLLSNRDGPEREYHQILEELGPDAGQLIVDILPLSGTLSSLYTASTGTEAISGRELTGWQRHVNWLWFGVGAVADVATALTFIPSGSVSLEANAAARLALLAARGSNAAIKLQRVFPRIAVLASRMGGWQDLVRSTYRFMGRADDTRQVLDKVAFRGALAATTITVGGFTTELLYGVKEGDEGFAVSEDLTMDSIVESAVSSEAHETPKEADIEPLEEAA